MSDEALQLNDNPDWHSAASELVSGLVLLSDDELRIELLERLCLKLGDQLYPAFLQILYVIQEHADDKARAAVARTLVDCLRSGRLPSGKLAAWGSSGLTGDSAFGQSRRLGPIEYVCTWYAQPSDEAAMSQLQFTRILESLLCLVSADDAARQLYCQKLFSDADDPLGGSMSSQTRQGLRELTMNWQENSEPRECIDAFLASLQSESLLNQIGRRPFE